MKLNPFIAAFASILTFNSSYLCAQGPFTIGTLHPNDSIIIIYDVQINNPLVPPTTTQISNQGTISGSNFSNVLTDDPDTGPANDPTITFLNMFPLPVTLLEFKAKPLITKVELSWLVTNEENFLRYEVERSADARQFSIIGFVSSLNQASTSTYFFQDQAPFSDVNFYRLKMIDRDGRFRYSPVVRVNLSEQERSISIFPNPVIQNNIHIRLTNMERGNYFLTLYNNLGQEVFRTILYHDGGTVVKTLSVPRNAGKGFFSIYIGSGKDRFSQLVIIQ